METRSFKLAEFRFLKTRDRNHPVNEDDGEEYEDDTDDDDEDRGLASGYASVFNSLSEDLGGFREIISPDAFTRSLTEAKSGNRNVFAYWSHDPSQPIGSTNSGTLQLNSDDKGLAFKLDPQRLNNMQASALRDGDMRMSFGFVVRSDSWSPDYSLRTINDLDLFEVSPVTDPAYSATSAGMRSGADVSEALESMKRAKEQRGETAPEASETRAVNKYDPSTTRIELKHRILSNLFNPRV